MAYSEIIAQKIRNSLKHLDDVEEKKMFGGLVFMVNGKMCLVAGAKEMMCRIDPQIHEIEVKKPGCSTVVMRGRDYKGYIDIQEDYLKEESDLKYWVDLALDYNKQLISKEK
ncbi:MAG: hypothetical protein CSA15_05005 [Candidatus Delongbacteria bacterium]|nr:MAG: hypothetical protein CSA15_05005 [Candidatus Delongbacteria bacterium]